MKNRVIAMKVLGAALGATLLGGCATMASPSSNGDMDSILGAMLRGESATQGSKLEAAIEKASAYDLGSKENPVRAEMPPGQRAYLNRLRCADKSRPTYNRRGSFGASPYGNIVDGYDVKCEGSEPEESLIFIDMYHKGHVEDEAVPGFTITGR